MGITGLSFYRYQLDVAEAKAIQRSLFNLNFWQHFIDKQIIFQKNPVYIFSFLDHIESQEAAHGAKKIPKEPKNVINDRRAP